MLKRPYQFHHLDHTLIRTYVGMHTGPSGKFFQRFAFLMASHRFSVVIHEVSTGAAGLISGALDISCGDFYQVNS